MTGTPANINLTLAKHPGLFRHFAGFTGKLLLGGKLPARDRELLILRTAWRCACSYEWGQHRQIAQRAGLSVDEIDRVPHEQDVSWSVGDRALFDAVDELVEAHRISAETWHQLAGRYDDQQLIELVLCIGAYTMVAGCLNSIEVEPDAGLASLPPR
ncbi:MAG TPA: carboxymuconolactone decarboxylase family protein [Jatrophihabitantaceae bacterium]|nr:carboxymuconolactone decarboxylase family protein [Jatrophihabitantaceae bacterium]